MATRKTTNKVHNKKLRRRREGLSTKCYEYGELDGVELALFVRYPKRGDFYSYVSRRELPWLRDVTKLMTHPKARTEYPEDLKERVEDTRMKMRKAKDAGVLVQAGSDGQGGQDGSSAPVPVLSAADFPDFSLLHPLCAVFASSVPAAFPLAPNVNYMTAYKKGLFTITMVQEDAVAGRANEWSYVSSILTALSRRPTPQSGAPGVSL
ncbi:hypothetical protein PMIN01_12106 [Paraphaeosphaeria minitans]|uniref:MADS-box domain-containing protein n=1 Tax=Paraphaeosphaeria minitans TaxID=565426 RepID=A0A9P6G7J0_9PLEO|nr:hypothetical protein PMIN01_12106 [Paraphaeosphaeria minitans]